jgi:hypothetical protein
MTGTSGLSPDAPDPYLTFLYEAVTKGLNTTSYKLALWRALARLAPGTDEEKPVISKRDLAPLFLEYYWPLEVQYHLRQATDPTRDPVVMMVIRTAKDAGKPVYTTRSCSISPSKFM